MARVTVVMWLDGLDLAMVSVVLASGDLDSAMVDAADADRCQQLTHLPTPIRT